MTYLELIEKAERLLDANKITLGEWERMTEPLRRPILPDFVAERRGKWIRYENSVFEKRWKCSSCKRFTFHNGEMLKRYKYCPNCGAKMEGADET